MEHLMQENNVDISFIIPVFNGEKVITRLLGSIGQMPSAITHEVIVVNDGSTDGTAKILEMFQNENENMRVITTENKGQSHARNEGLKNASGAYVFFADADDAVCAGGIASLFYAANKERCEMACGTYVRIEDGKKPFRALKDLESGIVSRTEGTLFSKLKTESAFGYLWNKLFQRKWLFEQGLLFDDTIPVYMEDHLYILKAFACGARFFFLNEVVYEYHFEGVSQTRKPDAHIAEKSAAMLNSYGAFLKEKKAAEENQDLFVPLAMRMICWAAFKNIRYEGAVHAKIKERFLTFTREPVIKDMLQHPERKCHLKTISSFLQRAFYGFVFTQLQKKRERFLAAVFVITSPLLKQAAKHMVR